MKNNFKKGVWIALGIFLAMFVFRIIYGYIVSPIYYAEPRVSHGNVVSTSRFVFQRKNYASYKYIKKSSGGAGLTASEKYEKIGTLLNKSRKFEQDRDKVYRTIKSFKAVIQFEQKLGLKGSRRLYLGIGVNPEKFDTMISSLKGIGEQVSFRVVKSDKTNEYRKLKAKRKSLEKARSALISLRGKGKVDESIKLETRILDVERQIQALGVKLGDFDNVNEFCTVKLTLSEYRKTAKKGIPFIRRVKVAFEWTVKYYLMLSGLVLILVMIIALGVVLLEKLGGLKQK